ncbi:hypothetical protein JT739_10290 [Tepidanaerobacter sp. GT38]|uniref:AAA family ATPase n=1 Tax=Tepidanaerobacter sp. GT38 TaxID=2722793 RepID=UPI001F1F76AA|nr:hypothetical protein [Tepidanaerobacter sp. GT38]MCG1012979.1 hypothetical protein [Tepidanaerobacter sp. GT38]
MEQTKGKVTVWWSAGGGVGKTTLASAYASYLTKQNEPDSVALLDFNEVFPRIHKVFRTEHLSLSPVYDAIEKKEVTVDVLKRVMDKKQGIWIMPGVFLSDFEQYGPEHFIEIIKLARQVYKEIVVDVNAGMFFSTTYAALNEGDEIRVVLEPSLYSLEDTVFACDFVVNSWGVDRSKIKAVVNKYDNSDFDSEAARRILGVEADVIKENESIKEAFEKGQVSKIADIIFGKTQKTNGRKNIFSFFVRSEPNVAN